MGDPRPEGVYPVWSDSLPGLEENVPQLSIVKVYGNGTIAGVMLTRAEAELVAQEINVKRWEFPLPTGESIK